MKEAYLLQILKNTDWRNFKPLTPLTVELCNVGAVVNVSSPEARKLWGAPGGLLVLLGAQVVYVFICFE
jgi:hypothetical protein